jgi:hypothetical protein
MSFPMNQMLRISALVVATRRESKAMKKRALTMRMQVEVKPVPLRVVSNNLKSAESLKKMTMSDLLFVR